MGPLLPALRQGMSIPDDVPTLVIWSMLFNKAFNENETYDVDELMAALRDKCDDQNPPEKDIADMVAAFSE